MMDNDVHISDDLGDLEQVLKNIKEDVRKLEISIRSMQIMCDPHLSFSEAEDKIKQLKIKFALDDD